MEQEAIYCTSCGERIDQDYYQCCGCGQRFCLEDTHAFTEGDDRVCITCYGIWSRLCEIRKLSHLVGLPERIQEYARHLASLSGPDPALSRPS